MEALLGLFREYGLWLTFGGILLESTGLPIPGEAILLFSGVMAAQGEMNLLLIPAVAAMAILVADSAWFLVGRQRGMAILGLACRVTFNADRCVSVATRSLHRWGWLSVLVGKFLIGVRMTIPPLAGGIQMPYGRFLALDLVGASAWASLFASLGYTFHRQIAGLLTFVQHLNAAVIVAGILAAFALLVKRFFLLAGPASEDDHTVRTGPDSGRV